MIGWREVFREAWRDTASGASRALIGLALFAVGVGALGWAQASGVAQVARDAARWVDAGASVRIVDFGGAVDGAQCDALAAVEGMVASGAVRPGGSWRLAALPSRELKTFEVTPGLAGVLRPSMAEPATGLGVWLSEDLARAVGAIPGGVLPVRGSETPVAVAGIFPFPDDDGRSPVLTYSVLEVVPPTGVFDACWVEVWPERADTELLGVLVANPLPADERGQRPLPQVAPLNSSLGTSFGAQARLDRLPTVALIGAAGVFGLLLGAGLVRLRRLELASALHAGVDKASLAVQISVETGIWVGAGAVAAWPVLWWASNGTPDGPWPALFPAVQTVVVAGIAAVLGAVAAILATREKHLFRLFKNR